MNVNKITQTHKRTANTTTSTICIIVTYSYNKTMRNFKLRTEKASKEETNILLMWRPSCIKIKNFGHVSSCEIRDKNIVPPNEPCIGIGDRFDLDWQVVFL